MIVACRSRTVDGFFPSSLRAFWQEHRLEASLPLSIGTRYPVVAVTNYQGLAWYYVHDDDRLPWPVWYPACLFEVVDGSLPASWQFRYVEVTVDNQYPVLSFPEWAGDRYFYERLVNGDARAVETYAARRLEIEQV